MGVPVLWVNLRVVSPEDGWLGQDKPEKKGWKMEEEGQSSTLETQMVTSGLAFPLQKVGK